MDYDKETEEVYLCARYYQPKAGRFLTRDTYTGEEDELLSLHLYTYCKNDGVNAWDPSGHKVYARTTCTDVEKHNYKNLNKNQATENAKYIMNFLKVKRWKKISICAILGNFFEECNMNPRHWQYWKNTRYGYGLAQWSPATKFFDYANLSTKSANAMAKAWPETLMNSELNNFIKSLDDGVSWKVSKERLYKIKIKKKHIKVRKMSVNQFKKNSKKATLKELVYAFNAHYEKSGNTKDMVQKRRYRPAYDFYKYKKFKRDDYHN